MLRSLVTRLGIVVSALALQAVVAAGAYAHGLSITAEAVCAADGSTVINYTAISASHLPGEGENPDIRIYVNGLEADSGAFEAATGNMFSGSVPAPSGDTATVMAVANADWLDGAPGGQSDSVTIDLPTDCVSVTGNGRFTGGGHQIRIDGVRITRGLTIHCDLLLSNNLEVNWQGNQFHMEEHLVTVQCSDDPAIGQFPPAAPLDTLIGVGVGRYNGVDGYTIAFTLVDYGEPGSNDQASFLIFETANPANVVLDVPLQILLGGNLQAHYDQPHR